jgi:hypothetical protein
VYPMHPSGAPATTITHLSLKMLNPTQRYPLSEIVESSARIRSASGPNIGSESTEVSSFFAQWQSHPLDQGTFCQDITIFRPPHQTIELHRVSVKQAVSGTIAGSLGSLAAKRGSGITEMMRMKSRSDVEDQFVAEHGVKARWSLPTVEQDLLVVSDPRHNARVSLA